MAKVSTKKQSDEPQNIEVTYDIASLTTAHHRAGLAGLLLQIEHMEERQRSGHIAESTEIPTILDVSAKHAIVGFTRQSVQALLDDIYSAETVEIPAKGSREAKTVVRPVGPFLRRYWSDEKEIWHKLWREMLQGVPRNRPTSQFPFQRRAKGEPTAEGVELWRALVADEHARRDGRRNMVELTGSVMLGAQAYNSDSVRFEDFADSALLLHFWPLTARVFVPQQIQQNKRTKQWEKEFKGFVLAIPDVADLVAFRIAYTRMLGMLSPAPNWYRPAEAVISIPDQGALEFMRHLDDLASRKVVDEGPARHLAGVEFFYMVPSGQNVKLMAHGRIPPDKGLLQKYGSLKGVCRNPILLSCRLLAILRKKPWFAETAGPLAERPWWFFVHSGQESNRTPPAMAGFAWEVDRRFKGLREAYLKERAEILDTGEEDVSQLEQWPEAVDRLVYDLVYSYIKERACARAGVQPDDKEWWTKTAEERRDVCSKLFLELRSRNDDDFVRHFTATIGSVPQWLDADRYLAVAAALMRPFTDEHAEDRPRTRDDVKTLTLLALSAHSRSYTPRDDAGAGPATDEETGS